MKHNQPTILHPCYTLVQHLFLLPRIWYPVTSWSRMSEWSSHVWLLRSYIFYHYFALTIFTNPSARAGYDMRSIFKQSLTGLNSEFSFSWTSCLAKTEEPSLPYYLPIAGFILFPRVLMLCEMQSATSRIWTHVALTNVSLYSGYVFLFGI